MEQWNNGISGYFPTSFKNDTIHEINESWKVKKPIVVILAVHRLQFITQYKRWIGSVVIENVRKILAHPVTVLGFNINQCKKYLVGIANIYSCY